jgi:hypothetical protein
LPILFNTLKLVLPCDDIVEISANGKTGKIALEFDNHRNKGGCVYSIPCCITHFCEIPNFHRDESGNWSDNASGNKSLDGKLCSTSKIIDGDEWT